MLKALRHRRAGFVELQEQPLPCDCSQDPQCRVHRLALEELSRAGLIGQKLDRLQQAEIGLRVSRRLLEQGTEGR